MSIPRIYTDDEIAAALGHIRRVLIEGTTPLHPTTRRAIRTLNTAVIEVLTRRHEADPGSPPPKPPTHKELEEC